MAVATITTKSARTSSRTASESSPRTSAAASRRTPPALRRKPLPAGRPREWYETHNRRLKAMRLAIALLDSGVYAPEKASNRRIRSTAARIGIHPPSNTTCRMVRTLIG
ncbi:hypothetical protein ACFY7Z_12895 [Streptomyces sp. NPDC012623]|uniref:hypothetical protein n=1 Tax=unclassified Streptomyces TaxID=2593676 RepID=UPI0036CC6D1E